MLARSKLNSTERKISEAFIVDASFNMYMGIYNYIKVYKYICYKYILKLVSMYFTYLFYDLLCDI